MNLSEYSARVRQLLQGGVKAGIWGDETYPNGTLVLLVATVHEYGIPEKNVPETAWFRTAVAKYQNTWAKLMQELAANAINAMQPINWHPLGEQMVKDMRQGLLDAGLHDTGRLSESIRYEVVT